MGNEEYLLYTASTSEEIAGAIKRLKSRKAAGPDGIVAEHLKEGGETVAIWIRGVMNAIIELEEVPSIRRVG